MICVKVRLFATLRENRDKEIIIELPDGATLLDVVKHLNIPKEEASLLLINGVFAKLDKALEDNDTVSIFPPVGGG
ncbi:MAG: MoaD/ThiS family protein [Lutispora sp.]|jgi:molybdopterin synthase sulfur carrier subunit|uniref:MoaD/ThiS family protein n=1 Tax=Lutispora sp. TaxID=2828727 RepID=UPI00356413E3